MFYHAIGHEMPAFNRKLMMTVLLVAGTGVVLGAAVVVLLWQPVL